MSEVNKFRKTIEVSSPHANIDTNYGPYKSIQKALEGVRKNVREKGRTVGILESGSVVEYWFKDGIEDLDLVVKGGGTTGDYIPLTGTEEGKSMSGVFNSDGEDVALVSFVNNESIAGITYSDRNVGLIVENPEYSVGIESGQKLSDVIGTVISSHYNDDLPGKILGFGMGSYDDFSEVLPENKLIYAQRQYVDNAIENFDAPQDGNFYARQNGVWVDITSRLNP